MRSKKPLPKKGTAPPISPVSENSRLSLSLEERRIELKAHAELSAIVENLGEGLTIVDRDGNVVQRNALGTAMSILTQGTGQAMRDIVGLVELFDLDGNTVPYENWPFNRVFRGEQLKNVVLRVRPTGTGREGVLSYNGTLMRDQSGEPMYAVLTYHDVTEQVQAQRALAESEERYRALFDNMSEGFFLAEMIYDTSGKAVDYRHLAANTALEHIIGMKREELAGKLRSEVLPMPSPWIELMGRVARTGRAETLEEFSPGLKKYFSVLAYSPRQGQVACLVKDVSERVQAEASVRESEEKFRRLVETSNEGVSVGDAEGRLTFVNERFAKMLGYNGPEEMVGRPVFEFLADKEAGREILKKRLEGKTDSYEFAYLRKDGSRLWAIVNAAPLIDGDGKVYGAFGMITDITERKHAEEALQKAHDELEQRVQSRTAALKRSTEALQAERQRFMDVLDRLPAYVALLDRNYQVPFANRFFEERFGKSLGRRCFEYLFNRDQPCEECETFKVFQTGGPLKWEWTGPDGRCYDVSDFPFTDTDGSPMVLEMGLDITERKRAEDELEKHRNHLEELVRARTKELEEANTSLHKEIAERRQVERALQESEERFRVMANSTPVMIWVTDANGEIVMVNHAYEAFFDITEARMKVPGAWQMRVHPDDAGIYTERFYRSLREKMPFDAECRLLTGTGEWRWVHAYAAPRFSSSGEFLGVVGSSPDVTDQKNAALALERDAANLKAMVAHANVATMVLDEHGVIEAVSAVGARLLGYHEADLVGTSAEQLIEPLSEFERQQRLREIQTNTSWPFVSRIRLKTRSGTLQPFIVEVAQLGQNPRVARYFIRFERLDAIGQRKLGESPQPG